REVLAEDLAEHLFGGAVGRPVVVREIEVRDAEVEGAAQDRPARLDGALVPEVPPEPERDRRQLQAAAPAAVVGHVLVAVVCGGGTPPFRPFPPSPLGG